MTLITTTLTLAALLGTANASPWAVPVPSLMKLKADTPLPSTGSKVQLSVARGECEGFQVLAREGVAPFEAPRASLKNTQGKGLELTWYRTGFVPVATASNAEGKPGLWADPLVPFDAAKRWTAPRQALYAELCVPVAAAPGSYTGWAELEAPEQ